jgi:type IV pilus assembly protein PilQ
MWATGIAAVALLAAAPGPAAAQPGRSAVRAMGIVETGPGRVSVDVQGAEIRTLLRAFSEFSGRNIVVGKEVKGTVSVSVRDMPWREALVTVLRSHGLDLTEENGAIRVDLAERLQAEILARETNEARILEVRPLETRLVPLNFANAQELQTVVQSVLSRRGQIQVDQRTNTLVVTDVPEAVAKAERMATELDKETPQIEIVSKLVDVDVSSLRELGITWSATDLNIGNTSDTFEEFDILAGIADPLFRFKIGTMTNPGELEVELQALELQRKADIISNPRITTVDNREAKILVGQKIPLIVQDVAGNAVSQLTTIGIQLRVTPHLTADKKIVLDIHPEVSDLATQSTVQGGIIINTSEADTRVMVDDGQTAVIGGLIRDNTSRVRTGVPFLMDIPLLGYLFSSTSDIEAKRELVIFVTPSLVRSE